MRRVLAIAFPIAFFLVACQVNVQQGLDEPSANEVVTALERNGIAAKKEKGEGQEGGYGVQVGQSDVARAMELMHSLGLPRSQRNGLAETYGQPSLVPSPTEERARFLKALANDIEKTLETIEGVVSARVHLVLAENDPLAADPRPRVPASASVLLKTRAEVKLGIQVADVQKLVAGSVPGLVPANVAVVDTPAPEWTGAGAPTVIAMGPLRMSPGSQKVLVGVFLGILGVVAVLALFLLFTARRLAAVQRERRG
jgi:type III secretion protein J